MENKITTMKEIKEKISADSYSRKGEIITVRDGFFYTLGKTTQNLIDKVLNAFPNANIIDSGEHWTSFRGGAPLNKSSHWFVKFSL